MAGCDDEESCRCVMDLTEQSQHIQCPNDHFILKGCFDKIVSEESSSATHDDCNETLAGLFDEGLLTNLRSEELSSSDDSWSTMESTPLLSNNQSPWYDRHGDLLLFLLALVLWPVLVWVYLGVRDPVLIYVFLSLGALVAVCAVGLVFRLESTAAGRRRGVLIMLNLLAAMWIVFGGFFHLPATVAPARKMQ